MFIHPLYHWPPKSSWSDTPKSDRTWGDYGVYIHFPYCRNICDFCGYETRLINRVDAKSFADQATNQILWYKEVDNFQNSHLSSVFFGGGTASLMSPNDIAKILNGISELSKFDDMVEVTLEVEPGTLNRDDLRLVKSFGVNRISVCAQSFDDLTLSKLGRIHNSQASLDLIDDCLAVGIENIHLDLMYALPDQTINEWENTIQFASGLPISHLSAYKLYVYKHGFMHREKSLSKSEQQPKKEAEHAFQMYKLTLSILNEQKFEQYTYTEYAKKQKKCEYVKSCFDGRDVLPIGPSAFGRCDRSVWDNSPYAKLFFQDDFGRKFDRARILSGAEAFKRDVLLGFWLLSFDLHQLEKRYQVVTSQTIRSLLKDFQEKEFLEVEGSVVKLHESNSFWMGEPMKLLSEIQAEKWIESAKPVPNNTKTSINESTVLTQQNLELNSIVRMARRDPKFFNAVNSSPTKTFESLGYDISHPEIKIVLDAISNDVEPGANALKMREIWERVANEHLGTKKSAKDAGLA